MWSCPLNGTDGEDPLPCLHVQRALSALSLLYLLGGVPLGLGYNALLLLANLHDPGSMTMPDVYFANMAAAGLNPAAASRPGGWCSLWSPMGGTVQAPASPASLSQKDTTSFSLSISILSKI